MHQQKCKQQIAKRSLLLNWYKIFMPAGQGMHFSNTVNEDNITRLCEKRMSE
jgi:hypothetical protein